MERPSQEIKWNTAMVTVPAHHQRRRKRARLAGSCAKALTVNVSSGEYRIDGSEHAILLLLCGCAISPTWPGTVPATLHDPRQAERYPCFAVLIAALIEAEDGGGRALYTRVLAS